jgi:uncharacterized small protein (DUF1192 family)
MTIETMYEAKKALNDLSDYITSTYAEGYEAGQADLLHSLKAYFPDMKCVADISLRIEALQDEVKRGNA